MKKIRRTYPSKFKFQVALEAAKSQHSLGELAARFEVSSAQISQWKRKLLEEGPEVFSSARARAASADQSQLDNLHRKIGELEMQLLRLSCPPTHLSPSYRPISTSLFSANESVNASAARVASVASRRRSIGALSCKMQSKKSCACRKNAASNRS